MNRHLPVPFAGWEWYLNSTVKSLGRNDPTRHPTPCIFLFSPERYGNYRREVLKMNSPAEGGEACALWFNQVFSLLLLTPICPPLHLRPWSLSMKPLHPSLSECSLSATDMDWGGGCCFHTNSYNAHCPPPALTLFLYLGMDDTAVR